MNPLPLPHPKTKEQQEGLKRAYYAHFTPEQLIDHLLAQDEVLHRLTSERAYTIGQIKLLYVKKGT